MKDKGRNDWLVDKIMDARSKGRRILVFARHRDHIKALHDQFVRRWTGALYALADAADEGGRGRQETTTALLWGGLKPGERARALKADILFSTHGFGREALNVTHIDTLIFATPPGDPLQPAGRLRDKGDEDRRSLLILDPFESNDYSFNKAMRRKKSYGDLGMPVKRLAKKA